MPLLAMEFCHFEQYHFDFALVSFLFCANTAADPPQVQLAIATPAVVPVREPV